MPNRRTRRDAARWVDFVPLGIEGLDYATNQALARPRSLVVGENVRLDSGALESRLFGVKLYAAANPTGSKTFGTDAKYATIPAATQLQISSGGFAALIHCTAVWAGAGNTGYILSSRVNGQSYHVLQATISDAGVITVTWEKTSGGSCTVATAAVSNGATVHLLAVFDAVSGTFTVYVNGASSGTPVTGLAATEKPVAGAGTAWHLGAHYDPGTPGVVLNTHFDGKIDGFTLMSLRGTRPASGTTTLVATLRKHSFRQWPAPQMASVLACYDCDETGISTMTDRSRFKNTATLVGSPSDTAEVAYASLPTNVVGHVSYPSGRRTNFFGNYGRIFYEDIRAGI